MGLKNSLNYSWNYFRRGNIYANVIAQMANMVLLSFSFVLVAFFFIENTLANLLIYGALAAVAYYIGCTVLGWWDIYHGSCPLEQQLYMEVNPTWIDLRKSMMLHYQGKDDAAIALLKKWDKKVSNYYGVEN